MNGLTKGPNGATVGNSSTTSDSLLTISGVTTNTTYAGVLQDSLSGGTRKLGLTVADGTFTLTASNTFSGDTRLAGGTLVLGNANAVRNSTLDLKFDDTGLVSFGSQTSVAVGGFKGERNLALTNGAGAAVAVTVGTGFSGTNIFYGALTGSGSLTKTGPGTQVLAGNNTFTGILNVDTGQPSTGNDGALRLAGALTSASAIQIRNQNSATSTLQLDGSLANISLPQPVTLNGRNNATPAFVNLAGDNTFAGNITLGSGGSSYVFQSDADTLALGGVVGIHSLTSARTLTFQGNGNFWVSGAITNGSAWPNSVVKLGAGTLTLAGSNTYSGTTAVTNGGLRVNGVLGTNLLTLVNATLSGEGVIRGPVTMSGSSALAPGNGVGTLTISNNLTLPSQTLMELDRSAAPNSDRLNAASLGYAGTLIVTNVGARLQVGDTFDLFNWSGFRSGNFTTVVLPPGYTWDSANLNVDGSVTVTAVEPPPVLNAVSSGGMLEFTWTSSFNYKLQAQWSTANVGLIPDEEAWFDYPDGGTSPVSVPLDPAQPAMFFRLAPAP